MSQRRDAASRLATGADPPGDGPAVRRADGDLQLGVGPGALVVRGSAHGPTARVLGSALLPDLAGEEVVASCPVVGHGPVATRLRRALGDVTDASEASEASLTVLVHQHVVPPEVGVASARRGSLDLPVVVQARRVVVGPLPGPPDHPCLHCLDLHRRDRDPSWPELATWLGHPARQIEPLPVAAAVLAVVEGLVRLLVSSSLAGRPLTRGLAHEVGARPPHLVTRTWQRHPGCPWHPGGAGPA